MTDIAGALFFFAGIIVVIAFAVSGLVLSWGERQTRQIAALEAKAAKPACCEVLDAVKKAA
jgi:lipopolysaccharide export LptBFGC system permease protein LptF